MQTKAIRGPLFCPDSGEIRCAACVASIGIVHFGSEVGYVPDVGLVVELVTGHMPWRTGWR
ncbi:hypothetical protein [Streptomyces smaragdinus]|uniref:hypothetical protein n=1 Tax=Streptomyces smaragdinus TaxID=2585196 RepID=UPI001297CFDD|nr:hypothetical protein [Streptomyces smaragdinus]